MSSTGAAVAGAAGSATAAAEPGAGRLMITLTVMLATVMQVLDTTIANVALPHMQGSLNATRDQIAWVLTSYIVAAAIMTPPTAWLAERFGRKRLFVAALGGFTVASVLCGLAGSLPEMVAFRVLQGMFGASLVPLSQSVLLDSYPRERHGSAMALWGVGIMIGPILGPTLGGWLTDAYDWRWVFYINLPVGALAILGVLAFVPAGGARSGRRLDWFGFAMLSLAVGALQMALDRGEQLDWFASPEIVAEFVLAGLALYLFLVQSFTAEHPFLDLRLLGDRNFAVGLVLMFAMGVILFATLALMPPMLQQLLGYPVFTAGLVLAPRGVGTMLAMLLVSRLVNRIDARLLVAFGLTLTTLSLWEMSGFSLQVGQWDVVRTGLIQGFGLGFVFVPLNTLAFANLPAHKRTEASSMFNLVRNIGSSVGISVVVTALSRGAQANHALLAGHVTPYLSSAPLPPLWDVTRAAGAAALNAEITRQATMIAYLNDFAMMMAMTLAMLPLLLLLSGRGGGRPARAAAGA